MRNGKRLSDKTTATVNTTERIATKAIVCILGMHRSGTSCLAGCLEEQGLHLGDVVDSAPFNLKGNKENITLRAINDDVLSLSGGSWDDPPDQLIWNDALRNRRDEHILSNRAHDIWGFKDPRTVITLPFWLEAHSEFRFVGTFRHPRAVVESLMRRNVLQPAIPPLKLWKHYNRKLIEYVDQLQFPLVCFDRPAEEYNRGLKAVVQYLGLAKLRGTSLQFFDNNLRSKNSGDDNDELVDDESLAIYDRLLELSLNADEVLLK